MSDGVVVDLTKFSKGSKLKQWLRTTFFIQPIVRELRGYMLDVGCGLGLTLREYHGKSLGIDANAGNIKSCKKAGLNVIKADANTFVNENTFDSILLANVLEHFQTPDKVLRNTYLSVKSGGRIVIVVPCFHSCMIKFNPLIGHKWFISQDYVDYYLLGWGCKRIKSYTFPFMDLPYFRNYRELRLIYRKG